MLEAGRVDYVVASFVNGVRLIGSLGLDGKVEPLLSRSLKEDDMYVIFSKARISPDLVDACRPTHSGKYTASTFPQLLMSPADKPLATLLSREQVQGRRVSLVCGIRIRRKRMAGSHPTETSRLALGNGRNGGAP